MKDFGNRFSRSGNRFCNRKGFQIVPNHSKPFQEIPQNSKWTALFNNNNFSFEQARNK
jgi:hypothetical protein